MSSFITPAVFALRGEQLRGDAAHADFLQRPDDPAREEDQRHRQRHVEIGVGAAEERLLDHEAFRRVVPQPMVPTPGIEPDPVGGEDEDEDRGEEPERPLHQVRTDDAFEQPVETLSISHSRKFCAPPGTWVMRRVAICAKTIRPAATIHVTTIEFVIGNPNGLAISTAFVEGRAPPVATSAKMTSEDMPIPSRISTRHASTPASAAGPQRHSS